MWLADTKPKSGTVAESNSLLEASFRNWGYEVDISPILPDNAEILKEKRGVWCRKV